jgi:uridylate kinase
VVVTDAGSSPSGDADQPAEPTPPDTAARPALKYKRILLKLSGEALMGEQEYGIDSDLLRRIAAHLKQVADMGVELAIVVGGGNIFRGVAGVKVGIDRVTGDHMGMLATVINALALMSALELEGAQVRVQTAIEMHEVAEPFIVRRAVRHLEQGRIVIFAAGTGQPYFSTDTAATLRAAEINADALLMAKNKVDGVYDADPNRVPNAKRYDEVDYSRVIALRVMDATAAAMAGDQEIPLHVFDFAEPDNVRRIVLGETVGTVVRRIDHAG